MCRYSNPIEHQIENVEIIGRKIKKIRIVSTEKIVDIKKEKRTS